MFGMESIIYYDEIDKEIEKNGFAYLYTIPFLKRTKDNINELPHTIKKIKLYYDHSFTRENAKEEGAILHVESDFDLKDFFGKKESLSRTAIILPKFLFENDNNIKIPILRILNTAKPCFKTENDALHYACYNIALLYPTIYSHYKKKYKQFKSKLQKGELFKQGFQFHAFFWDKKFQPEMSDKKDVFHFAMLLKKASALGNKYRDIFYRISRCVGYDNDKALSLMNSINWKEYSLIETIFYLWRTKTVAERNELIKNFLKLKIDTLWKIEK